MPRPGRAPSGSMRPLGRRSSHSAAGIGRRSSAGYSSRWAIVRTPAMSPATAGWASGNCIAAARTGTSWRSQASREAAGRARRPRAARASSRTRRRAAGRRARRCSSRPPTSTATPRSTHAGRSVGERLLVEQRVAAGEQDDVDVGLADEPRRASRDWFMPAPIARTTPCLAQPVERRVGAARSPPASGRRGRGCRRCRSGRGPSRSRLSSIERLTPSAL